MKKKYKNKVDMAKEKAEMARFGTQYVMSLKPVQRKILKSEKKPDEGQIFDFSWSQGQDVKMGKKEKKDYKNHNQNLDMSFYNTRSKRYNPPK